VDNFRDTAFGLTLWYAVLAILVGVLLIVLNDLQPPVAFLAGANIALLFALGLILKTRSLKEDNISRDTFWCTVPRRDRPRGQSGLRMARVMFERILLSFARGAAVVAIIFCALALASHHESTSASAQTLPEAASVDRSALAADE
jgi:drug/metabolite transporter (DMT)-like permease